MTAQVTPISREIAPPAGQYHLLPIAQITPSPLNPRKHFDEAFIVELAGSIQDHGLQQPIVVRTRVPDPDRYSYSISPADIEARRYSILDLRRATEGEHPDTVAHVVGIEAAEAWTDLLNSAPYEIIMGEQRYRACGMAGLTEIPCIVRTDVTTDQKHLELAIIENLHRRDVDAIEQAQGYQELSRMGYSQSEIARRVNCSQPTVANAIRLLELPDIGRRAIQSGQLGATHGRALLKYAAFPRFLEAIIPKIIEERTPTHELEKALPWQILEVARDAKTIVRLPPYGGELDHATVCKDCPFDAFRANGYGHDCFNPDHYTQMVKEAKAAKAKANAEAIAEAKADPKKVPLLRSMSYDSYALLPRDGTEPAGCSADCACRSLGKDTAGCIVPICLDPKRYRKFEQATEAEKDAARKAGIKCTLNDAMELLQVLTTDDVDLIAYMADFWLENARPNDIQAAANALGITAKKAGAGPEMKDLAKSGPAARAFRRRLSALDLLRLTVATRMQQSAREAIGWTYGKVENISTFVQETQRHIDLAPLPKYMTCPKCRGDMRLQPTDDPDQDPVYSCACGHSSATKMEAIDA